MKIGFKAYLKESGELYFDPDHYQPEVTDIGGRKVCIRLLKGMLSDKLTAGMSLGLDLPDRLALVVIQEIEFESGWVILHCKSKGAFPAIVIGRQPLATAIK